MGKSRFYRVVTECEVGWLGKKMLVGGMSMIDLPSCKAPDYKGSKGCCFWYTARGWRKSGAAKMIRNAQVSEGITLKVKVTTARPSDVVWTNGIEAILHKS